jgi:uncharacterized protein (DUF1015 family)
MNTEIQPFCGWRFSEALAKDYAKLIVPPYDVISAKELEQMKKDHQYNFTHVILGEGENKHKVAAELVEKMASEEVIQRESEKALYFYKQTFKLSRLERFCQEPGLPEKLSRKGFFALVKLHDYKDRVILPHEKTFSGPKADRLELMTEAQGQMEPVFLG